MVCKYNAAPGLAKPSHFDYLFGRVWESLQKVVSFQPVSITCRLREVMHIRYMQISHMAFNFGKQCHVVMLCDYMMT